MNNGISQMQVLYQSEEDRILFRVSSTDKKEFRFWVTRRFTIMLLKILKDHMDLDPDVSVQDTPDAKQAVAEGADLPPIRALSRSHPTYPCPPCESRSLRVDGTRGRSRSDSLRPRSRRVLAPAGSMPGGQRLRVA